MVSDCVESIYICSTYMPNNHRGERYFTDLRQVYSKKIVQYRRVSQHNVYAVKYFCVKKDNSIVGVTPFDRPEK